jgi:hypothetical protein
MSVLASRSQSSVGAQPGLDGGKVGHDEEVSIDGCDVVCVVCFWCVDVGVGVGCCGVLISGMVSQWFCDDNRINDLNDWRTVTGRLGAQRVHVM